MTIASLLMSFRHLVLFLTKIWTFLSMLFKKKMRTVMQHQSVNYVMCPLSPASKYRLSLVQKKILVLDLDETLIHSHHDGLVRPTVKPGTPPDFILRVSLILRNFFFFCFKK